MSSQLSPSQQRLRDMEVLLLWEGALDNARLREVFGVQAVQASRLLASFLVEHKDGIERASAHAPITPGRGFRPQFAGTSPDEYLGLIATTRPRQVAPHVEDLRLDLTPVDSRVYAAVTQACRGGSGLQICYRSLSNPQGESRLVYPHSLVRAARRWHMRAWCTLRRDYRDFALGRIVEVSLDEKLAPRSPADDTEWNEVARLVIEPHPALSEGQMALLRDEYFAGKTQRVVEVRRALVSYTLHDLRLAVDFKTQVPPEYQLALINAHEFKNAFALKRTLS